MLVNASSDKNIPKSIYLDNAAATHLRDEVFEVMLPYLRDTYGNPSSIHHKGREASDAIIRAREDVARALGVHAHELIFTSGGTEANNLALKGVMYAMRETKKHLLISSIEHASIVSTGEQLKKEGFDVEYIPVDSYGTVSINDVLSRIRPDTALISIMYANNEIGTVQALREVTAALQEKFPLATQRPLFHTDACQAPGQLPITLDELGVDLMTLNGGKINGPKGTGLLYVRNGTLCNPQIIGGEQEQEKRAGTENVAGIVGFAKALTLAVLEEKESAERLSGLRDMFIEKVIKAIPETVLNGHPSQRLPNNVHFSFPYIEGESLVLMLDLYGICASTGSACNAHNLLPSSVLRATQQSHELIHGSIRFTLGKETCEEDLEYTATTLTDCVTRLKALSPLPLHL